MYAIQNNDIDQVKDVMPECDINHTVSRTGVMVCILKKHNEILKYLISQGADPNTFWRENIFAIHEAVNSDNCEAVEILLNSGANINSEDGNGNTALILAIRMQNYDIVELLKFADHSHMNKFGYIGIFYAISQFDIKMIKMLLKNNTNYSTADCEISPALIAAYFGCDKGLKLLISDGADLSHKYDGKTALEWAKSNGRVQCIQILEKYKQ